MKFLILLIVLIVMFIVGCAEEVVNENELCLIIDQVKRERLFFKCLEALPKGPDNVKYNDWDDVVDACMDFSYKTSEIVVYRRDQHAGYLIKKKAE